MIITRSERACIDRERGAIGLVAQLALHGWRMRGTCWTRSCSNTMN
jgi:hypothetical protein